MKLFPNWLRAKQSEKNEKKVKEKTITHRQKIITEEELRFIIDEVSNQHEKNLKSKGYLFIDEELLLNVFFECSRLKKRLLNVKKETKIAYLGSQTKVSFDLPTKNENFVFSFHCVDITRGGFSYTIFLKKKNSNDQLLIAEKEEDINLDEWLTYFLNCYSGKRLDELPKGYIKQNLFDEFTFYPGDGQKISRNICKFHYKYIIFAHEEFRPWMSEIRSQLLELNKEIEASKRQERLAKNEKFNKEMEEQNKKHAAVKSIELEYINS